MPLIPALQLMSEHELQRFDRVSVVLADDVTFLPSFSL